LIPVTQGPGPPQHIQQNQVLICQGQYCDNGQLIDAANKIKSHGTSKIRFDGTKKTNSKSPLGLPSKLRKAYEKVNNLEESEVQRGNLNMETSSEKGIITLSKSFRGVAACWSSPP
jgi:hypothetical protein